MTENKMGKLISKLRKEKMITQSELANALNVSNKAVSKWENGLTVPNIEMTYQLSKYFNVSFADLSQVLVSDQVNDVEIFRDIIKKFKSNQSKKGNILKILGLILSFLRLIVAIIDIILNKLK